MNTVKPGRLRGIHRSLLGLAVCGATLSLANQSKGPLLRDHSAALEASALPQARIDPILIDPSAQIITAPAPPCGPAKMRAVRAPATRGSEPREGADFEFIDCSLTFDPTDVRPVTKRLVLEGTKATGVSVDCNGVTIDGGPGTPTYNPADPWNMVEIRPKRLDDTGLKWEHPLNIAFRHNCKIRGSVGVLGIDGVPSSTDGYVMLARNNAPRNIVFDGATITGVKCDKARAGLPQCAPLYIFSGVNHFQLLNSTINGTTGGPNIYLDDLSFRNTLRHNRIEASNQKDGKAREVLAIDGSSENTIVDNFFSSLEDGGIYLYRNCGEDNSPRLGRPTDNVIVNNVFFYDTYDGPNPSVFVAQRNGKDTKTVDCPPNFFDLARSNAIMQNQVFKLPVDDVVIRDPITGGVVLKLGMVRVGHPEVNTPNFIEHNETVKKQIERPAGCFVGNGYPNFILDGQFTNAFHNPNGDPMCTDRRATCHDGALSQTSDSTCQADPVRQMDVDCQATDSNSGCERTFSVPPGKKIVGAKAACNLEFGAVSTADLDAVPANLVQVLRASDTLSEGRCTVGGTSLGRSMAAIVGVNGLNGVTIGCREHDANGGDCHIKARLYFR